MATLTTRNSEPYFPNRHAPDEFIAGCFLADPTTAYANFFNLIYDDVV